LKVLAGANGCGKTAHTRYSREELQDSPIVDPDAIAKAQQAESSSENSDVDAGRVVLRTVEKLLHADQDFTVETTLSGHTY